MVDVTSAPVLGFLGGVFGGIIAQSLAYFRRRKRHLDRLRSVLKETQNLTESQLDSADQGHSEMTDEDILRLQNELKKARLQAAYLLSDDHREKIDTVQTQFSLISHSAGDIPTSLDNGQLADQFQEKSTEALDSLPRI
mgnify:CR=1 FL=1